MIGLPNWLQLAMIQKKIFEVAAPFVLLSLALFTLFILRLRAVRFF